MTVIYDLVCEGCHRFEGWFQSPEHYEQQCDAGLLTCPQCGSAVVRKLPTMSRVNTRTSAQAAGAEATEDGSRNAIVAKLHEYIESNFDDVGTRFAEEARKIHYGEAEKRNIRGQASGQQIKGLLEEGISVLPVPGQDKSKLN